MKPAPPLAPLLRSAALVLLAWGCSTTVPVLQPPSAPGLAPHPYTPAMIRARCSPGTVLVYDVRSLDQLYRQRMTFRSADEDSAVVETAMVSATGKVIGDPRAGESTWVELRDHAAYPAATTEITETSCRVPAGEFDCWLYRVQEEDGVSSYWFSVDHPGPPVRVRTEKDGQVVFEMELAALESTAVSAPR